MRTSGAVSHSTTIASVTNASMGGSSVSGISSSSATGLPVLRKLRRRFLTQEEQAVIAKREREEF